MLHYNMAAYCLLPMEFFQLKTTIEQIDWLYYYADDPATPKTRSMQYLKLIKRIRQKLPAYA